MNRRSFVSLVAALPLISVAKQSSAQTVVPPELIALGVQEDGRWISPRFGVEVTWGAPFALDYTPGGSVFSNEYGDQFNIALPNTDALFNVSVSGPANTAHKPFYQAEQSLRDFEKNNSPSFLLFSATDASVGALVVIEWGKNVLTGADIPNQVFLLQTYQFSSDPDIVIQTRIDAGYDDIEDYVRALDEHVTVDGTTGLRAFALDAVLDALQLLPPEK